MRRIQQTASISVYSLTRTPNRPEWDPRPRTHDLEELMTTLTQPDFSLSGQVAVVTGAGRGIGHDLALALAGAGASVAVAARVGSDADPIVETITRSGGRAIGVELEVGDTASIEPAMQSVRDQLGSLDVLVNNAGLGANHPAEHVTESDWDDMMNVNAKGLFFCCQAAGRIMLDQGHGRIINMGSQAGLVGIRDHAVYSASKGAVNMLTKVLALEWSERGVNVNAVAPTFIRTPGTAERLDDPEFAAEVLARIPAGRVGTTADVAGAVIYLASPAAALVTGHILTVDGGWTAQ